MVTALTLLSYLLAVLSSAQTLRKYNSRGCQGALAVCSVRSDVGAEQNWPQASCCDRGAKKSGSLRISGVQGSVGELSIVCRGNFNTQCSVQDSVFLGSPVGCFTTRSLGTGASLSCAREYVNNSFNRNCSNYKKKRRSISNATASGEDDTPINNDIEPVFTTLERQQDPEYLAPGFYDAFERPISEDEYWRQVEWEDTNDGSFVPEDDPALIESRQDADGLDSSSSLARITEANKCYQSGNGASFFVTSLAGNFKVVTYTDSGCTENAFNAIQAIRGVGAAGCYDTDSFESA